MRLKQTMREAFSQNKDDNIPGSIGGCPLNLTSRFYNTISK